MPVSIAEQPGSVAGVEVTDGAQVFVVAAGKRGTGADASFRRHDRPVELEAEFSHGIGFIYVFGCEKLRRPGAESLLGGGDNRAVFFQPSRHVEQAKDHAVGRDPHEIIEVAPLALTVISGGQLGGVELGNLRLHRLLRGHRRFLVVEEEAHGDN